MTRRIKVSNDSYSDNEVNESNEPEDLHADVNAISDDVSAMTARLSFEEVLNTLNQRLGQLQSINDELRRLRSRGFVYWPNLEQQLAEAKRTADKVTNDAKHESQRAGQQLRSALTGLSQRAQTLQRAHRIDGNALDALMSERDRIETELASIETRIQAAANPFTQLVDTVAAGVAGSHYTMDQYDQASFRCRAEENPLAVAAATWEDSPQGALEGVLYLTDLIIRFERTAGGQRGLVFEKPIGHIASSEDSERGWFAKDEVLTLSFQGGGPSRVTLVMKSADSKSIDSFIEAARSGQVVAWKVQRANAPIAQSAAVPVKWPNECDNCGAKIAAPVRGQMEVVCAYCKKNYPVEFAKE